MPQLNFAQNLNWTPSQSFTVNANSLSFFRFTPTDSISWNTLNFPVTVSAANLFTLTFSVGLYSFNAGTLSLANSVSGSYTQTLASEAFWMSLNATSAAQNITPGSWWIAPLINSAVLLGGAMTVGFFGIATLNPGNAVQAGFLAGAMTQSTTALPASVATSDMNVTGVTAIQTPAIYLSS